jgi:hypothetical protein
MKCITSYWFSIAPVSPRGTNRRRVGMEGAAGSTTADDASTAGSTATEERSEGPVSTASGTTEVAAPSNARRPSSGTPESSRGGFQLASEEHMKIKQLLHIVQ